MKSKIILLAMIAFLISLANQIKAQDVIILTNGEEILSIVKEVGIDVIKYQKYDNQNGPVYVLEKAKVFMIKYQNGTKDVFSETKTETKKETPPKDSVENKTTVTIIKKPPQYLNYSWGVKLNNTKLDNASVRRLYSNYPEATNLFNSGTAYHAAASTLSWLEIGMLFLTGYAQNHLELIPGATKQSVTKRGLTIIGCMMVVGVSCNITGHSKKRKSVEVYNAAVKKEFEEVK